MENVCRQLPSPISDHPHPTSAAAIDPQLYASLWDLLAVLRTASVDPHVGWDSGLKTAMVRRLEDAGLRYDAMTNRFVATSKSAAAATVDVQMNRNAKLPSGSAVVDDDMSTGNCLLLFIFIFIYYILCFQIRCFIVIVIIV